MGVGVVVEAVALDTPGHMHVGGAVEGKPLHEPERVEIVVSCVGVDVGDVEQEQSTGAFDELMQELGLLDLRLWPLKQRGDRLEGQRHGEPLDGHRYVLDQHLEGVAASGYGQEVAGLDAPARTKATCSLTSGASTRSARRARWSSRAESGKLGAA